MEKELTVQELLFNDQPVVINRKLAKCLGLKEAVVFQQIHYWLEINKRTKNNFKENKYWTYNSVKAWHENEFDFLSLRTVERTLQKLEKDGLLESKVFNKMAGDKTKWYTINYDKLLEVCNKKLSEKEILSSKRKDAGRKGAKVKASKMDVSEPIQPNWQNGDPCNQFGRTIQPTWQNDTTNLAEAIPEITTKTTTEITICNLCNNSKGDKSPQALRFESIMNKKLGTSTLPKFEEYVSKYDSDFIDTILDYAEENNAGSFAWFKSAIDKYINNNMLTRKEVEQDIEKFRDSSRKAKNRALKEKDENKNLDNAIEAAKERELDEFANKDNDISSGVEVEEVKEVIKDCVSESVFKAWIAPNRFLDVKDKIVMVCKNNLTKDVIERKYYDEICNHLKINGINKRLEFNIESI